MLLTQEIIALFSKEAKLEFRQRYAIGGIVLFLLSTVFVAFYAIGRNFDVVVLSDAMRGGKPQQDSAIWSALFWIVVLFASVTAVTKSFTGENERRQLFYYQLASPISIVLSKCLYNSLLLILLGITAFGLFCLILGNPILYPMLFLSTIVVGAIGIAFSTTFTAALASKAKNSGTLTAVLSFPVLIPILMTVLRLSRYATGAIINTAYINDFLILFAIIGIMIGLIIILFPFLWRN